MNVLTSANSSEGYSIAGKREMHVQAVRGTGAVSVEIDRGLGFQEELVFSEDKTEILQLKDCKVRFIITGDAQVGWS